MSGAHAVDSRHRRAWEVPDCPNCGGHLYVWSFGGGPSKTELAESRGIDPSGVVSWRCHAPGCGTQFLASDPLIPGQTDEKPDRLRERGGQRRDGDES